MKTLRSYFWWTYQRGSFHYDIMVTLILAFIFITPHLWDYRDRPQFRIPSQVMVQNNGDGELIYQVRVEDVDQIAKNHLPLETALEHVIEPIAGDIRIEHYETIKNTGGKPIAYKVWAHR